LSSRRPSAVVLSTTLGPVAHGALAALAARETPGAPAANAVLVRLIRQDLDRVCPGLWDLLVERAAGLSHELTPRDVSQAVAEMAAERFRQRGQG